MTKHDVLANRLSIHGTRRILRAVALSAGFARWRPLHGSDDEQYGPEGFAEMIGAFQAQMPGLKFERVGGIDATGVMVRFSWRLVNAGGRQLASGTDVGEFPSMDGLPALPVFPTAR